MLDKTIATSLADALQSVLAPKPGEVREREILRVAATLGGDRAEQSAEKARKEVLKWAQKRVGDRLPEAAWKYNEFEKQMGGRDCKAVRIVDETRDLWAIRANDPDKNIAQRVWTTEVVIGFAKAPRALLGFGLRLLVSSPEADLQNVERAVPGLVRQLADECGLYQEARRLSPKPWIVESRDDATGLIDVLLDPSRKEPVFVLTVPGDATDLRAPLVDPGPLALTLLGLARIVVLPARFTWVLTERLGKRLSVFDGAVRAYLPEFTEDAEPYDHHLFLRDKLSGPASVQQVSVALRQTAAAESLRRLRLGHDVLSFSTVQAHSVTIASARLEHVEKNMITEIGHLRESLKKAENDQEWFAVQHDHAEKRAKNLEQKLSQANFRIQYLIEQLATHDDKPDSNLSLPDTWEDFPEWCENHLSGRVLLSSKARRGVKAPLFEDVGMAARCLLWLANDYRQGRLEGNSDLRNSMEGGLKNEPCGADGFKFDWQGRQVDVAWHIKNGGNTRSPARCLRIYYFWDEGSQRVVIASMPAHTRSGAT